MGDWMSSIKSFTENKISEYAEGMSFPASKNEIVEHARRQNLPPEVMDRLEKLPDKKYESISELISTAVRE